MTRLPSYPGGSNFSPPEHPERESERGGVLAGLAARMKLFGFMLLGLGSLGGIGSVLRFNPVVLVLCGLYFVMGLWSVRAGNAFIRPADSPAASEDNLVEGLRGLRSFFTMLCLLIFLAIVVGFGMAFSG